jgi:cell division protein FtsL
MHRAINWVLMLLTLASAFALYALKYDTRRLEARVQAQERQLEKAQADVAVLKAERAHLARPERLEPLARELGLAPIAGRQYLRVDMEKPQTSPSPRLSPIHSPGRGSSNGPGDKRGEGIRPASPANLAR